MEKFGSGINIPDPQHGKIVSQISDLGVKKYHVRIRNTGYYVKINYPNK
jgi:hypothetical protein